MVRRSGEHDLTAYGKFAESCLTSAKLSPRQSRAFPARVSVHSCSKPRRQHTRAGRRAAAPGLVCRSAGNKISRGAIPLKIIASRRSARSGFIREFFSSPPQPRIVAFRSPAVRTSAEWYSISTRERSARVKATASSRRSNVQLELETKCAVSL